MKRILYYIVFTTIPLIALQNKALAVSCKVQSASGIVFGDNVDLTLSGNTDVTGQIVVYCESTGLIQLISRHVRVCVSLGRGRGGFSNGWRTMLSGNSTLRYNLYQDASHQISWGSIFDFSYGQPKGETFVLQPRSNITVPFNIYGRLPGGQIGASPGSYHSQFTTSDIKIYYDEALNEDLLSTCEHMQSNEISTEFLVRTTVAKSCSVNAHTIDFGTHASLSNRLVSAGGLDIICSPDATYKITLNRGLYGDASGRRMQSENGDFIPYQLTLDNQCTNPWDRQVQWTSTSQIEKVPIYGCVGPQEGVSSGKYSDVVTAEIEY